MFGTVEIMIVSEKNILVVEDEIEIRELMALHLLRNGYRVKECGNVFDAMAELKKGTFELIVLDWMLPGKSGVEFLEDLKEIGAQTPRVLMVTAKSEPEDIVHGLERGADDYLTKPFDPLVFLARVKALLRRSDLGIEALGTKISVGGLTIDSDAHEVQINSDRLHLTPSEYKLILAIVQNQGRVLTREQLIENIQGEGVNVTGRTVDTHVFGLRKKLGIWGENIETIRGVGYRLKMDLL